jgi:deazaflavin-dependent oxidoreductase (nitroreductase family)
MSEKKSEQKPQVPPDMKEFNRKLIAEFRANHGQLSGQMAGAKLMLLTTKGARSGDEHTVVLGFRPAGDGYVVIASNNGAAGDPAWYRNLQKDPTATVEVGTEKHRVKARTTSGEERERLAAKVDYLEGQQKLTERQIPVVALETVR